MSARVGGGQHNTSTAGGGAEGTLEPRGNRGFEIWTLVNEGSVASLHTTHTLIYAGQMGL